MPTYVSGKNTFQWGPNVHEFQKRFSAERTNGEGKYRVENYLLPNLVVK